VKLGYSVNIRAWYIIGPVCTRLLERLIGFVILSSSVPTVSVNGRLITVERGTPLDVAIKKAGFRGLFRSVKFGRLRDIMDDSYLYPQYKCVYVNGYGLVNPLSFQVEGDITVIIDRRASFGSILSGKLPFFGVGFQNSGLIRTGFGWKIMRRMILSSANLPKYAGEKVVRPESGRLTTNILIVGGGPAGMGLAQALLEKNLDFLLVDPNPTLGGRIRYALNFPQLRRALNFDAEGLAKIIATRRIVGLFTGLYEEGVGLVVGENRILRVEFSRLVYANGSKCPPPLFAGNDSPGVISVDYALRLRHFGVLMSPVVFYVEDEWGEMVYRALKDDLLPVLVSPLNLEDKVASHIKQVRLSSKELVVTLDNGSRVKAKYVVYSTLRQPNLELPAQAGFAYSFSAQRGKIVCTEAKGEPSSNAPVLLAGSVTGLYELNDAFRHGRAIGYTLSGDMDSALKLTPPPTVVHPSTTGVVHQDAFVCFCEDVRVRDFVLAQHKKLRGPEKTKRFTGWGTGVCQGKLCIANGMRILGDRPYTQRLPTQPTPLAWLASLGDETSEL